MFYNYLNYIDIYLCLNATIISSIIVNEEGTCLLKLVCDYFSRSNISNISFLNRKITKNLQLFPCTSVFETIEICMIMNKRVLHVLFQIMYFCNTPHQLNGKVETKKKISAVLKLKPIIQKST